MLMYAMSGCGEGPGSAGNTGTSGSSGIQGLPGTPLSGRGLPSQMHGDWRFDRKRTLAAMETAAVTDEQKQQFAMTVAFADAMEKQGLPLHSDIRVEPARIVGHGGPLEPQYDFTSLNMEEGRAVGKVWHHEDRHDPGDMSSQDIVVWITDEGYLVLELGPRGQASQLHFRRN